MFYSIYEDLCKKAEKKPYAVAREIGLGNSNVAQWKKGSTPRPEVLQKIADYFGVTTGYLMGYEQQKKPIAQDDGLTEDQVRAIEKIKNMPPDELARKMAALEAVLDM